MYGECVGPSPFMLIFSIKILCGPCIELTPMEYIYTFPLCRFPVTGMNLSQ